uniref:Uncharacterized protein n=1 Tax=Ditylenchus dipsaci TaxID=166011 RepID=A0A915DH61_9BILA
MENVEARVMTTNCLWVTNALTMCPHPSSSPQTDPLTGEIATCMHDPCAPGFSCQFSIHGRGSYICCSNPPIGSSTKMHRRRPNFKKIGQKSKWTPPPIQSSAALLSQCCRDRSCRAQHRQVNLICDKFYNKLPLD